MAKDIEEFLRRAAERRKQQKANQGRQPPVRQQPPVQQRPARQQPIEIPLQSNERLVIDSSGVEVVSKRGIREQGVAEHVREHINTSDIAAHVSHLGEQISQTDERVDERLHRSFDHDVGRLTRKPTVQSTESPEDEIAGVTTDLVQMLRSPKSVRQAILLAEILRRPEF